MEAKSAENLPLNGVLVAQKNRQKMIYNLD